MDTAKQIALITGITGQDGSYLAEELLENEWIVFGIMRRASVFTTERINEIWNHHNLHIRHGNMTDIAGLSHVLAEIKQLQPEKLHIFNLAAQSHVGVSFETPLYTANVDAIGVLNLLEAIKSAGLGAVARVYQASTSELYGKVVETPQSETTPFYPRSPYAVAKLYAFWIAKNYREAYGMHICNGIAHNHESDRRGKTFVTRKITLAVAKITNHVKWWKTTQKQRPVTEGCPQLALGNLESRRDWGHALDYVRGMMAILEHQGPPDDYVLATGECHSVREFVEAAFECVQAAVEWRGSGLDEVGLVTFADVPQIEVVRVDKMYFRPTEVDLLVGDASKAKRVLGWSPRLTFKQLVYCMVTSDLSLGW